MSSKRYPEEIKIEAIKQVTGRGYSITDIIKQIDITTHPKELVSIQ